MRKLFFLLLVAAGIQAVTPLQAHSPQPAVRAGDYPGADLVVVYDSTVADVQESGLTYVDMHRLYHVLTPAGALRMSVVKIGYDPLSAHVEIRRVVVHKGGRKSDSRYQACDGGKHRGGDNGRYSGDGGSAANGRYSGEGGSAADRGSAADGRSAADGGGSYEVTSPVVDYPAPARKIYWGAREKMIEVGRLEPGDEVEVWLFRKGFTYALLDNQDDDSRYIPPMRGHYYDIIPFYDDDYINEKVYQVAVPKEKQVQYEIYNGEVRSSMIPRGDKMLYTFTRRDIKPFISEPNMVDPSDVATKLLISTSPDWFAKSVWFYNVNEDYGSFEPTPEIKAKTDEILRGARSELDSVALLTHWVADEIRYSGISMGVGEGYTLHTGEMTYSDRSGVCKDKAGLLVTMLRAAGFEAYAAMTMAGSRIDYIPADQFNHSVTAVRLSDGKYHLLDPTWVPFLRELWSSAEQQQQYLLGLPEGADLMVTPLSPAEDHYLRIVSNSELSADGTFSGRMTIQAEGQSDGVIRKMFTSNHKDQWDQWIRAELRRVHPAAEMVSVDYGNPYIYQDGPIDISCSYRIPGYAIVDGDHLVLNSFIASGFMARVMTYLNINTRAEERQYPFRDRCSRAVQLIDQITLPDNYQIVYRPEAEPVDEPSVSFRGGYDLVAGTSQLRLSLTANFHKRIYDAEDWPAFRSAVLAQKRFINEPVIMKKSNQ